MAALDPHVLAGVGAVVEGHPCVAAAWVFGSVARGEARSSSDLDLAVLIREPACATDEAELRVLSTELERFSPSGCVDIVVLGAQGAVFRQRVLRDGVLVVDRDRAARHAYEALTIMQYLDWKPTHDIAMTSTMAGLRQRLAAGGR